MHQHQHQGYLTGDNHSRVKMDVRLMYDNFLQQSILRAFSTRSETRDIWASLIQLPKIHLSSTEYLITNLVNSDYASTNFSVFFCRHHNHHWYHQHHHHHHHHHHVLCLGLCIVDVRNKMITFAEGNNRCMKQSEKFVIFLRWKLFYFFKSLIIQEMISEWTLPKLLLN